MKAIACLGLALCLLAGLCACGQSAYEKDMSEYMSALSNATEEVTTTEVITTEAEPKPFEYTVTQRIHDDMPEFIFTLHGYGDGAYVNISEIEISGEDFSQQLDGFETENRFSLEDDYGLVFADFNTDGYLDIQLHQYRGGSMHNTPSLFWLWDTKQKKYVENKQLEEISEEHWVSVQDGRLLCGFRDGAFGYCLSVYSYINHTFVEIEREDVHPLNWDDVHNSIFVRDTYKLIGGELKLVSTEEEDWP
ncbi:MAG: hypothetical protein FWE98_03275 [Oscillospiraceae bacterium]|nr:hypothetical protein [Oscillospiraceae bacterium]